MVPASLEHLIIDARVTHETTDHPEVVLEAISGGQWESDETPLEDDVVEYGLGVSIGAAAEEATGLQAGAHLDGCKPPRGPALATDERGRRLAGEPKASATDAYGRNARIMFGLRFPSSPHA